MPKYRLHYFDARGRTEPARLLFAAADVEFEDVRYTYEEWMEKKNDFSPFQKLPILEFKDKKLGQSVAIFNFIARKYGFYGDSVEESAVIDMVVQQATDLFQASVKAYTEEDEAEKEKQMKDLLEVQVPYTLDIFEYILSANNKGKGRHFAGSSLSLADIMVYNTLDELQKRMPGALENYPSVRRCYNFVHNDKKISKYVQNRKQTDF